MRTVPYYTVAKAADIVRPATITRDTEWDQVKSHSLPIGFHYLVYDGCRIVEPVLFYLHDKCVRSSRIPSVGNTQTALTYDLYEWFSYLGLFHRDWDAACFDDIELYRDRLLCSKSPKTGKRYAVATVRRRLGTIVDFYEWATRQGLIEFDAKEFYEERIKPRNYAITRMTHVQSGDNTVKTSKLLPRTYNSETAEAFSPEALQRVLAELGSIPGDKADRRPCRDRLIASLAVATGMRLDECANLTLSQYKNLKKDGSYSNVALPLYKTKGLKPRTVVIPGIIHDDLRHYVKTERARAVRRAKTSVEALFVNHAHAKRNPGEAITAHSIWRHFQHAVLKAGLVCSSHKNGTTSPSDRPEALHSFHHLRHTFAVTMYFELVRAGKAEPWLSLRTLLGHSHITTTINTYLRSVQIREALMTDNLNTYLKALRDG
ncbi:tyrosine-type recombinase/integrase [Thalassospira sp. A3_1]|uniref:tyrosine-type recombinase/integrase n=1 Tax=Thalassospira sp. A3_1 TaxID=2821088 RepID=UPI001AD9C43E|nr:tyrosine-type recombinase/integrase [Thalassospira sp. A3_1]MBO9509584.1 tyrosine-type recombinase/integrase [Thalassospira sp. A3_1]|tara:strand:+ start:321 stop:1616 length:1296 start_codon:yes stop_codon:yes gene_type:complete